MLSSAFLSKQRRSIFKKFLRLFEVPDFLKFIFFLMVYGRKGVFHFQKMGRKYLTMFIRYISIVVSSF